MVPIQDPSSVLPLHNPLTNDEKITEIEQLVKFGVGKHHDKNKLKGDEESAGDNENAVSCDYDNMI